jgi:S-adenosylmethionine:tRNA ribosyltransferase-isomerase
MESSESTVLDYVLPPDRIAERPLADRASSRLLVFQGPGAPIEHVSFRELGQKLPSGSFLVLNDTRVIHARIPVLKATGGAAEVLCLSPREPSRDPAVALGARGPALWEAMVGGKRILAGDILTHDSPEAQLLCEVVEKSGAEAVLRLSWSPAELTLGEIFERVGRVPLPPYLRRPAEDADRERYQTVYSRASGSVAAPTAGLHFTPEGLEDLRARGVALGTVTLHVGAGTFRPVETERVEDHAMHSERIRVSASFLSELRRQCQAGLPVVAVGTTSLRTLESLYWLGVRALGGELEDAAVATGAVELGQWDWKRLLSRFPEPPLAVDAVSALEGALAQARTTVLEGQTRLMVVPGYPFGVVDGLITNFHQPRSTLLSLVAAFVGNDSWRKIYAEALAHGYRFLSYGDSSLLWRPSVKGRLGSLAR